MKKLWRTLKTALGTRTLMTRIDPATQGQIFIVWEAAILQRRLANALEKAGLDMTVNEVLLTMRKIRMLCMKARVIAQHRCGRQRQTAVLSRRRGRPPKK